MGTLINTAAVIIGALIGLLLKKGIKPRFREILMSALGLSVIFIGASGTLNGFKTEENATMLLIFSLVLGALAGEALKIEDRLDALGERIKRLARREDDNTFVEGFVTASLVICVGAMAVLGALQDGLTGDYTTLAAKAVLDLVIVMVFASALGVGVLFSAVPLFVYQGALTLFAKLLEPLMSERLVADLSFVGSALIFCVGVNLAFGKKFKTGNLLPALLVPVFYTLIF
ncbi:MAG: DUF554 domain-containing protein [Bacteroides sp.]|nr:DUF554 domain-containing protein [Eubacterium sp.]MCM1418792.1 DUF554 domain-containing protein [Roseburia sp.]MCM1462449.1 DUF554 domain-containing protein [Bacteroides sp.]